MSEWMAQPAVAQPSGSRMMLTLVSLFLVSGCLAQGLRGEDEGCPRTAQLLREGQETVRIVCFGDSITGIYYHSGAARAWCDMVGIGLRRLYPQAKLQMVNAGISSQTSAHGLRRTAKDVLARKPTLVVVAFGMNDVRGKNPLPTQQSHDNLAQIVKLCVAAGAEVVLCTPTSVYHGYGEWPFERLAPYADMVHQLGTEEKVPVADIYRAFEDIRAADATAWMLLMSEWIHPNMNGHKVLAQELVRTVTGQSVALADVPAPVPGIPFTLAKLARGEPVKVVAMEPVDTIIVQALREINPKAVVTVTPIAVPDLALPKILASVGDIRAQKPDLVVIAVPASERRKWPRWLSRTPQPGANEDEEWYIRNYSDVYNAATSYTRREFDCIGILPAVLTPDLTRAQRRQQDLARASIRGHDLDPVARQDGDTSTPAQILTRWLQQQAPTTPAPVAP